MSFWLETKNFLISGKHEAENKDLILEHMCSLISLRISSEYYKYFLLSFLLSQKCMVQLSAHSSQSYRNPNVGAAR